MTFKQQQKREKILQYAERIWGITSGTPEEQINAAIEKTRAFFEEMQIKTHLSDYSITADSIPKLVAQLEAHHMVKLGEHQDITPDISRQILEMSL